MKTSKTLPLALIFNGLFTGASIFIMIAIVPFWKTLDETELNLWFSNHFQRFPMIMVPLNLMTFITILVGFMQHRKKEFSIKRWWLYALITIFLCSLTYPVFFDGANKILMTKNSSINNIYILYKWQIWHYLRTALSGLSIIFLAILTRKG